MRVRFLTADVFTDRIFGGNPLAVVPDARGLSGAQMQRIAGEFNLSETAFVLPPDDPAHTRRLRIFTPGAELPFAGHPTVGTAVVLASIGEVEMGGGEGRVVFEEGVGPVPVTIRAAAGRPLFAQLTTVGRPERLDVPVPPPDVLAYALSLLPAEVRAEPEGYAPEVWNAGVPFLCVPVRDLEALGRARISVDWEPVAAEMGLREVFVFTTETGAGADVRARMFAPGVGIAEDPATGAACSAMAGYLGVRTRLRDGTARWVVAQGVEMGRPSRLEVEADKAGGEVVAARVGGTGVLVSEGTMEVPDDEP